jgi:hypothetical protein
MARVRFSYATSATGLISIAPLKNVPLRRVVNRLLDDIQGRLADCRRSWWTTKRSTCLANQWALESSTGKIELVSQRSANARQIADASYDPSTEQLRVAFRDGTTQEVNIKAMTQHKITDAEYAGALAAGRTEAEMEVRAQAVRYVPDRDAIEIVTTRNAGFLIPRQWIGALLEVPVEDLAKLEVWPDGTAIELEDRDIHISVHGLMTAVLPAMLPARAVAAIFASRGGRATSDAKRNSAQANGRRGGRPPKRAKPEAA